MDVIHGIPIERHDELDSTSLHARRLIAAGEIDGPRVIVAATQTGGVGRFGRPWSSPRGGLWCTLIWPIDDDAAPVLDGLGLRLGLACLRTIDETLAREGVRALVQLKWPNDVYIDGKKALGLLTEVIHSERGATVLVGVGVNANVDIAALPSDLRERATTLRAMIGRDVDTDTLLEGLIVHIVAALRSNGVSSTIVNELGGRLFGVGEIAAFTLPGGETLRGELLRMNPHGHVVLLVDGEEQIAPPGAELMIDPVNAP